MNKRQRKKAGLRPRPPRKARKAFNKYFRHLTERLNVAVDFAIKRMSVGEIEREDCSRINRAVNGVMMCTIPVRNPYVTDFIHNITITRQLPGVIRHHTVTINLLV